MGRRSQKSRAGQARDRANRVVKESDSPADRSDDSSAAEQGDDEKDEDITDESSEAESTDEQESDDTADESSEAESTDEQESDDTADESSEAGVADDEISDDTADTTSETADSGSLADESTPQDSATSDALDGESADDIAAAYASVDADQSPQTCCPNCKTIFEVSPELLSSKDTRVRCGECLGIFDAHANLRQLEDTEGGEYDSTSDASCNGANDASGQIDAGNEDGTSVAQGSADVSANGTAVIDSLDVTYADFSLFSADAALPEIEYLDETREVQAFDFDDPGGDDELDETFSETLFAHGPEVDARSAIHETDTSNAEIEQSKTSGITDDEDLPATEQTSAGSRAASLDATLSGTYTGDELDELVGTLQRSESGITLEESPAGSWWLRGALSFLVLFLAAGLYGYREREALQHSHYLRPVLESFCTMIGCTLAEPVDLASLQVLNRSVFSHPKLNNVLVINIGFVNKASFNQRFPVLEIRLTDRNGGLVVKNSFEPSDYLDNWQPGDVLDAGKRLNISLNVKDPGNKATSFELDFR